MKDHSNGGKQSLFFPALTGYRAIAAWMIFIYHFMPFNNPKYPGLLKDIVHEFHLGVDMFFVLSGFLITYRYFNQQPLNFKNYMINRVARIYPMYFILTASVFVVWYLQNNFWNLEKTYEVITSITMTKALFTNYIFAGIPQGWTLTLEEMFYFSAPLFFILLRRSKYWLIVLPLLIFFVGDSLKTLFNTPANTTGFLQTKYYAYSIEFFTGIGLGLIMLKVKTPKISKLQIYTYIGLTIIITYLLTRSYFNSVFDLKSSLGRFIELGTISILGIAPLLWGLIHEKTFISNILSHKYMVLLGKSSYIFYLIHKGFIPIFINDYISDNKLIIFILLNIISILLFTSMEEPLNNYIRRKLGKRKA